MDKLSKMDLVSYVSDASRIIGNVVNVFLPKDVNEIQEIVKTSKFDIIPRGSGTNIVGGCVPDNSVIIDIGRMNKILKFNPSKNSIYVQAGILLSDLNERLNSTGFEFPFKLYNKDVSTIGSMIAVNTIGTNSMKYGHINEWIEEIEIVNGRGELMKFSKADLRDFCGMEGITGIIVSAKLKVISKSEKSISVFQSDKIEEVLSISRRLKSEKDVIMLEVFPPGVSKLLNLPEKYNLIVEFDSDRGKVKGKDYEFLESIRDKIYYNMHNKGYYNTEDPKFFFDKTKEFVSFFENNQIPYFCDIGMNIAYCFFRDDETVKRDLTIQFMKKGDIKFGRYGIGIKRKEFVDNFQKKIISRIKKRHDPLWRFKKGKIIDIDERIERVKTPDEEIFDLIKDAEKEERRVLEKEEQVKEYGKLMQEVEIIEVNEPIQNRDYTIEQQLKEYEDTFTSELTEERVREVENFVKEVPRTMASESKITDNLDRKSSLDINKIITNNFNIEDNKEDSKKENKDERDLIRDIMTNKRKEDEKK